MTEQNSDAVSARGGAESDGRGVAQDGARGDGSGVAQDGARGDGRGGITEFPEGSSGEVQLVTEYFRATKWTIQPGGAIPMHVHEYEYAVVPLVTATMHVTNADGSEIAAQLATGVSYSRPAGQEHRCENRESDAPIVFVEVERLK